MTGVTGRPETAYAWNGDVSLAYQVLGRGSIDLLYLQGYASHVDLNWDSPALAQLLNGLASRSRLIVTDRRGWGASDRFSPFDVSPIETMVDDIGTVMDAAGSNKAVILASQECGMMAALFAATYPDRARGLILVDPFALYDDGALLADGQALASADVDWDRLIGRIREVWGRAEMAANWEDPVERAWFPVFARSSIAPGGLVAEMQRFRYTDPRSVYPTIHVPTLILSTNGGDPINSQANGRYLASVIPGAQLVEQRAGFPWLHWYERRNAILDEVSSFLQRLRAEESTFDRVLASIMFTDIVDSAASAAELGDTAWREVLGRHHALVRASITRMRGSELDNAGDGFFAAFDGPGRAIRCAQLIVAGVQPLGLRVRVGIHTGECERIDGKLTGTAVNIGARIAALAGPGQILVSDTVRSLVAGSGIQMSRHGGQRLKGISTDVAVYSVEAPADVNLS